MSLVFDGVVRARFYPELEGAATPDHPAKLFSKAVYNFAIAGTSIDINVNAMRYNPL